MITKDVQIGCLNSNNCDVSSRFPRPQESETPVPEQEPNAESKSSGMIRFESCSL